MSASLPQSLVYLAEYRTFGNPGWSLNVRANRPCLRSFANFAMNEGSWKIQRWYQVMQCPKLRPINVEKSRWRVVRTARHESEVEEFLLAGLGID